MKKRDLEKLSSTELLKKALEKKVYDELIGSLKFDSIRKKWRFDYRNDFETSFKSPTDNISIVIILESPHVEEFRVRGVIDENSIKVNSRPLCNMSSRNGLCHLLNISLSNEITNGLINYQDKTLNVVLINAIQYQCSLGVSTKHFRDNIFFGTCIY